MKKILLATDHAGLDMKERLKTWLLTQSYELEDFGATSLNPEDDYPDFITPLSSKISQEPEQYMAFIFGGSGQGEAMVANRFRNVRAAVLACPNMDLVRLSREHNDANILSFGARFLDIDFVIAAAEIFLSTRFSEVGRHKRRISKFN